jgi:hypothetical protein
MGGYTPGAPVTPGFDLEKIEKEKEELKRIHDQLVGEKEAYV